MKYLLFTLLFACSADEAAPRPQPAPQTLTWRARLTTEIAALDATKREDLSVTAVIIDRLTQKLDAEDARAALVAQLSKSGGVYGDAIADLFAEENSAVVRAAYVRLSRELTTDQAISILRRAFADVTADVRVEAARVAGAHASGPRLASELRNALADSDVALRAEAARAIGTLKIEAAKGELVKALNDSSPDVRLEAMRSLDRIAPGSLAGTAAVVALQSDADVRVAELAKQLAIRN